MESRYSDEIMVDLMDMVFFFLKKWKSMVALLLICAVLGGGYAAMQPAAEREEYQPKAEILETMEDAYQLRTQYEQMLEQCLAMELSGDMEQYDAMLASVVRYQSLMTSLEKTLTGEDLTYYQTNYLGMEAEPVEAASASVVKYAVIGAFLGVVLWGAWYLVAYLADSTVKTAEALTGCGITLLGRVPTEKQEKGLNKVFASWQEKCKRPGTVVQYLAAVIDGAQEGQAILCGDRKCAEVMALSQEMEKISSKVKSAGFISESEEALKLVKQAQSEVLVIRTWKTKRAQIQRELEMCRVQNVKVLGMIVID